jgi:hypothetical protein
MWESERIFRPPVPHQLAGQLVRDLLLLQHHPTCLNTPAWASYMNPTALSLSKPYMLWWMYCTSKYSWPKTWIPLFHF